MLNHVVLFRLHDLNDSEAVIQRLRALTDQVPAIRGLEVGRNLVPSDRAYDCALIVRLDTLADLPVYNDHPAHQALLAWLRPKIKGAAAVDFET